ncbi:MAG TPA: sulfotransferase [Anaerolineae bacterium]|nr:sulfotransferase [Anaerolineae bacterium]
MSRALIITGMHRSGTSLVANLFDKAGVQLGAQLLAADKANPFGFFEDIDFLKFHADALHTRGQTLFVTREFSFTPTAAETQRARELIAARVSQSLWGWKDPRTSLFLDFWQDLLPNARFLFVYRHPLDVLVSLARRGEVLGLDFMVALEAWYVYNAQLVRFARQHPDTTLVCSSYALVENIEQFNRMLAQKFGLSLALNAALRDEIYRAEHLHRIPRTPQADALLRQIHPDAWRMYDALQTVAPLREAEPALSQVEGAMPTPSVELDALCRFVAQLDSPLAASQRPALLTMLLALTAPEAIDRVVNVDAQRTNELEWQRRAWQQTAEERARALQDQTAWALPRLHYLETLERSPLVRALVRLGVLPRA